MFREWVPARQLSAWVFAAITPVAIQLAAGASWPWTAIIAASCALMVWLAWTRGLGILSQWACVLGVLLAAMTAGELLPSAGDCWPTGNKTAVPLILLALAVWSAQKGPSAAARVGCVLFWVVVSIYFVVLAAGAKEVEIQWLRPEDTETDWDLAVLSLTPAAASVLMGKERRWGPRLLLPGAFILCACLIVGGVLSPMVVRGLDNPFYEMSRSLSVFGVAKRFEAVVSAGMTVGWFTLLSLYLTICGKLSENVRPGWGRLGAYAGAVLAVAWMLCDLHIPRPLLAILMAVFWVAMPLLAQGIARFKQVVKSKN